MVSEHTEHSQLESLASYLHHSREGNLTSVGVRLALSAFFTSNLYAVERQVAIQAMLGIRQLTELYFSPSFYMFSSLFKTVSELSRE